MSKEKKTPAVSEEVEKAVNVHKEFYEWMQCVVIALICCVLVFVFVARVIDVVGHSMVPTLQDGDKIIITRLAGDYDVGDIVVLRKDTFRAEPIVKRIIAEEGQTVDIDFTTGTVYVDDVALDEPYINERTYDPQDFEGPVLIPEGHVFVLGDNRNNSTDSRRATIGTVDERYIMGKVIFRILPFDKIGAIYGN